MAELSDELLMAYADGELEPVERRRVEALLADSPELQDKVRRFEMTRLPLQQAYDPVLREAVPSALVDLIRRSAVDRGAVADLARERAARVSSKAVRPEPLSGSARSSASWRPVALAASVGLMIGAAGAWFGKPAERGPASSALVAEGIVRHALETGRSGEIVRSSSADLAEVKPVVTFRSKDQQFCRQYELGRSGVAQFEGVACRQAAGAWEIKFHAEKAPRVAGPGKIAPAGSRQPSALDAQVERVIDGGILDPAEEQRTIEGRWKP